MKKLVFLITINLVLLAATNEVKAQNCASPDGQTKADDCVLAISYLKDMEKGIISLSAELVNMTSAMDCDPKDCPPICKLICNSICNQSGLSEGTHVQATNDRDNAVFSQAGKEFVSHVAERNQ